MFIYRKAIWRQQLAATLFFWGGLPLIVLGPGPLLEYVLQLHRLPHSHVLDVIALILACGGIVFVFWSTIDLQRLGGGTPSPFRPAGKLVISGSYRFCRHPMFFGYDLILLGAILLLQSPVDLLVCFPVYMFWSRRALRQEERLLQRRFKGDYSLYVQKVPFLIPFTKIW